MDKTDAGSSQANADFYILFDTNFGAASLKGSDNINDYGNNKLNPENGGSESALNEKQTIEPIQHLENNTYHYVHEIINHIQLKYDILYSIPGMNKWLHRNQFSYKKPKGPLINQLKNSRLILLVSTSV